MLSKNKIKFIQSLQRKKHRVAEGLFLLEGDKMAKEALEQAAVEHIYALNDWVEAHKVAIRSKEIPFTSITARELKSISGLTTPNRVVLVMKQFVPKLDEDSLSKGYALYLDQIQDPGNMGTILRNADWFGIQQVFCSEGCVDIYNSKVIQASMGAIFRVRIMNVSLTDLLQKKPELPVYGTVLGGNNIYEIEPAQNGLIVIGNEGRGISPDIQDLLTHKVTIPKGKNGGAESLNAAVASGIVCAVFSRKG